MRSIKQWALPLFLLVFCSGLGFAQSINSGDVRGTVTDETGAVIPGVKVTVQNLNTGVTKVFTSNGVGIYDTNSILPGSYKVTFEAAGFHTLVRGPITLEVGFTTVNAALKIGDTSEQVVVNTDVPLLTTESGDQSTTMDAKAMSQIPQIGQDWTQFVLLLPGASGTSSSSPGTQAAINGNLPFSNVLSDGASTTLGQSQNANPTTFEDVAELQVNTSTFSAQYGTGGVIFNQITKSGTSSYHGSAYEYLQNQWFSAHSYNFGATATALSALHWHNFGGALGGPVPFLKKAFFYFNYDHTINNGSNGSLNKYTVPTAAMMSGDFSEISTPLYDPTSQTLATDSNGTSYPVRQAFTGNVIPSGKLDSVASKFIQWYPTPDNHIAGGQFLCGTSTTTTCAVGAHGEPIDNFGSALSSPQPIIKYFGRLDYDVTSNHRLTMSVVQTDNPVINNPSGVESCPVGCQSADVENKNSQVSDVWTISSRLVNEARIGYTYQFNQYQDQTAGLGLPAELGWKFAKEDDFPDINFVDGDWAPAWINKQGNNLYKEHVFDPSDVVTLTLGKHIMHFGGEFLIYRNDSQSWNGGHQAGAFGFGSVNYAANGRNYTANWNVNSGTATPDTTTGWAMADFMLGYAATWSAQETPEFGARFKSPQLFFQDDYKVTPNLTVNLGLRWQMNHGWNEVHGNISSFDPNVKNSDGTMGAMWYASTHANGRTALEADVKNVFMPRVGFSWLKDPRTTLRGGFGIYSYMWSADNYGIGIGVPFGSSGSAQDATGGVTPIVKLDGDGTNFVTGAALPWVQNSTAVDAQNGSSSVSYTPYHTPVPRIMQWNLAAQREITTNTSIELDYVASHGYNLLFGSVGGVNFNQIPESELLSTGTNTAAIPYPNFNAINGYSSNAVSNYNSLQAQLIRRFAHGLSLNFNYVWSHMLDTLDSSGWGSQAGSLNYQNSYSPSQNYGGSNFDTRNAFKGYAIYQLPFGKGERFLNNSRLVDEIVGGWQLAGSIVLSSGNPFTITDNSNHQTNANGGGAFPNWGTAAWKPTHQTPQYWYNPGAFVRPQDGTFGNVRRNSLVGPGLNVVNLSGHKEFFLANAWNHDMKLQLRVDAYNAFNHPSFGQPNTEISGASAAGDAYTQTGAGTGSDVWQISSVTVPGRKLQFALRLSF
jgi:hypothetical protein